MLSEDGKVFFCIFSLQCPNCFKLPFSESCWSRGETSHEKKDSDNLPSRRSIRHQKILGLLGLSGNLVKIMFMWFFFPCQSHKWLRFLATVKSKALWVRSGNGGENECTQKQWTLEFDSKAKWRELVSHKLGGQDQEKIQQYSD